MSELECLLKVRGLVKCVVLPPACRFIELSHSKYVVESEKGSGWPRDEPDVSHRGMYVIWKAGFVNTLGACEGSMPGIVGAEQFPFESVVRRRGVCV